MKLSSIFLSLFFSLNTAFAANTTTVLGYPSGQATQVCAPTSANSQCLGQGGGGSGTVSSGTVGQEAVYTGTTTVGSGIITDNGTNVGIGETKAVVGSEGIEPPPPPQAGSTKRAKRMR